MLRLVAAAALLALCACGGLIGPTQANLEQAMRDYYADVEHARASAFASARIADFEVCQPFSGVFKCAVVLSTADGAVAAVIWIVRKPDGGWLVRNIARNERTP